MPTVNISIMKISKSFLTVIIILIVVASEIKAQAMSSTRVPEAVVASFNKKYPGSKIKRWKTKENKFIAKAEINDHTSSVAFDKNGEWVSTISRITWTRQLPPVVYNAYKKSKYNALNVYYIARIEKPSGEYYRIIVDDRNSRADSNHQPLFKTDKLLEFKADGILAQVMDVSDSPADYMRGDK